MPPPKPTQLGKLRNTKMADNRCFVQFSHPGKEHNLASGRDWNRSKCGHKRKFMQLRGKWVEVDGIERADDLWAWGEWEPESDLIPQFNPPRNDSQHPCYLWDPYYVPKDSYRGLHNTDPFIFGERFLYSNCGQKKTGSMKHLDRGSVIAFGSGKKIGGKPKWMLDTVLVVGDFVEYDTCKVRMELEDQAPATFLDVIGGPLVDNYGNASTSGNCAPTSATLRLYQGATPNDPVQGMFSFFPAIPAGGSSGFPRPLIDLPRKYFNPKSWEGPKGVGKERTCDELSGLWNQLVKQVRDAGLVLGTHAELPERQGK